MKEARRKFLLSAMLALFILLTAVLAVINGAGFTMASADADRVTQMIAQQNGVLGMPMMPMERRDAFGGLGPMGPKSPEINKSMRYFTIVFDESGKAEVLSFELAAVTREEAISWAETLKGEETGWSRGTYRYRVYEIDGKKAVTVIDQGREMLPAYRILFISVTGEIAALIIGFLFLLTVSRKLFRPLEEADRRQKQFIAEAEREFKVPLTVIRANTEIEEMMNGESEWTRSTMRQVDRLSGLVQNLVMISRAQEREDRSVMTAIDVSKNVEETVRPFESLAQQEEKQLIIDIMPDIHMVADESKIRQLASLLIDNAFKYCDEKGRIRVQLDTLKKGKTVRLIFSNTFAEGAGVNYSRFFERFYREDESHNVDKGGYGIGLSIAESICQQYGGSISVSWKNGEIAFTCLLT